MRAMCRGHVASVQPLRALRDSPAGGAAEGGAFDSREARSAKGDIVTKGENMAAVAIEVGEQAKWSAYLNQAGKAIGAVTDRRVMNNMDPETKAIHLRLEAWARWSKSSPELREYPEVSMMGKMEEYGPEAMASFMSNGVRVPASMPEAIEVIERAVTKLGEIDRKVIDAYYLRWAPVAALAVKCRMREREFLNVLRRARFRVRCYVEAAGE